MTLDALPAQLAPAYRARSAAAGGAYFAVAAAAYLATFVLMFLAGNVWLSTALAAGNGLAVAVLFVVGHDACHGSLTPSARMNRVLGVLSLLPSWHPYHSWAYTHNGLHHGWTNLKGRDPVYCPFTYEEFTALSRRRRAAERIYRTLPGLGLMYLVEIWWKQEFAPPRAARGHAPGFVRDRRYVVMFMAAQVAAGALLLSARHGAGAGVVSVLLESAGWIVLSYAVWNWLMGFATYQHHTHPSVRWYDSEAEWNRQRAQVEASVHIVFPRWVSATLCNIMEHTAHHVDVRVPLYRLPDAQRAVEQASGAVVEVFTLANLRRTLRVCKLYDFRRHRWTDFNGVPTADTKPAAAAR